MSSEPLTAEQIEELKKRHIRSFCMRRGHISNAQEKALEELLPLYEIPYDANQNVRCGLRHSEIISIGS